jgi:hypothetical protein
MTVGPVRNRQFAADAMIFAGQALVVLEIAEDRKHLFIVPVSTAHLRPGIVILARTANVDHRVD